MDEYLKALSQIYSINKHELRDLIREMGKEEVKGNKVSDTDMLLDEYNDYMTLYKTFGDLKYKQHADMVMMRLRAKSEEVSA